MYLRILLIVSCFLLEGQLYKKIKTLQNVVNPLCVNPRDIFSFIPYPKKKKKKAATFVYYFLIIFIIIKEV